MAVFELLAEPANYVADSWDLTNDEAGRVFWLDHFKANFQKTLEAARQALVTDAQKLDATIAQVQRDFRVRLQVLREKPESMKPFTIFGLDRLRQDILNKFGLQDPFLKIKHQENIKACGLYPRLIKAHEKLDDESLLWVLTQGIFAGNVFDLGSSIIAQKYSSEGLDFYRILDELPERPWLVDNYEAWRDFLLEPGHTLKRMMLFVDNSGCDFILGCLPLARALAKQGATVVLAANDRPCLNDMTVPECKAVLRALAQDDEVLSFLLQTRRIRVIGTGNGYPLIDFKKISTTCNRAAEGVNLLILEGMGRSVESNWKVRFECPVLKIAMLKNEWVAEKLQGKSGDLVCRFET